MKFNLLFYSLYTCALIIATYQAKAQTTPNQPISNKSNQLANHWTFNKMNTYVFDETQAKKDSLYGNYEYVPGVKGNAIKFDGFRTYIERNQQTEHKLTGAFTVESWIALASPTSCTRTYSS